MHAYLRALLFFAIVFVAAYAVRLLVAPGVLPVDIDEHPSGNFLTAFVLKSVENVGLYGSIIVLIFGLGWLLTGFVRRAGGR
jgi:hypothetical protein